MDSTVKIWDLQGNLKFDFKDQADEVTYLEWHQKGNALLVGCQDGPILLYNCNKGQCLGGFYGHESEVTRCLFTPDGKYVVSSSMDGSVRIWNPKTMQAQYKLSGYNFHEKDVLTFAFGDKNPLVLSGDA